MKKGNNKGFTLIEIIAVLVIMGVLAAVAVPQFVSLKDSAELTALKSAVSELNGSTKVLWYKNLVENAGTPYAGYTGNLGPDFTITGQTADTPASGTIKMTGGTKTLTLTWTPEATGPGYFTVSED